MILRGRRSGSLRVVLGTSIVWLVIFWSTRDHWCHQNQLLNEEGNLPAKKSILENINEGINNVHRGESDP